MNFTQRSCLFCQIINKSLPAAIVMENSHALAFSDLNPVAPLHLLIIPKIHIENINNITQETGEYLTAIMIMARDLAKKFDVDESGYRLVINNQAGAQQSVFHLHLHFLAKRIFSWPPG